MFLINHLQFRKICSGSEKQKSYFNILKSSVQFENKIYNSERLELHDSLVTIGNLMEGKHGEAFQTNYCHKGQGHRGACRMLLQESHTATQQLYFRLGAVNSKHLKQPFTS